MKELNIWLSKKEGKNVDREILKHQKKQIEELNYTL
jgi:hypothetical protein